MDNKGPLFSISGLAVLLAAIGVIIFTQSPFVGNRPGAPEHFEYSQKAKARLWQDPFTAVLVHHKALKAEKLTEGKKEYSQSVQFNTKQEKEKSITSAKETYADKNVQSNLALPQPISEPLEKRIKNKKKPTILGVMVPGGLFAEQTETRMRSRYAVLSSLGRLGFVPEDAEHMEYLSLISNKDSESGKLTMSNILPFEWFEHGQNNSLVLLLWLNEDIFQYQPLINLQILLKKLCIEGNEFILIGPALSSTLKEMIKQAAESSRCPGERILNGVAIYSAMATVDDDILLKNISTKHKSIKDIFLANCGIKFHKTISSDKILVKKLIEELKLRHIDPVTDNIALVAEWDTYYGQSLRGAFKEAVRNKVRGKIDNIERDRRLYNFSYLRGIDGSLPGDKEIKEEKKDAQPDLQKSSEDVKKLEQPVGKSQLDYLRRLAKEIYRLDRDLWDSDQGRIKAIGILGSDFYDKYLVLQALQQRFPEAVFFTTDLDARFVHPANLQWTKNLIVASSYDLKLCRILQGDIPPFRDSYQTSLFYAVMQSFKDAETKLGSLEKDLLENNEIPDAMLFEIGRDGAYALSDSSVNSVQPRKHEELIRSKKFIIRGCIIVILFILLLCLMNMPVRVFIKNRISSKRELLKTASCIAILLLMFYSFYNFVMSNSNEEPFYLFAGISTWPTEILRLLAVSLSIYFLITVDRRLIKNSEDIKKIFLEEMQNRVIDSEDSPTEIFRKYLAREELKSRSPRVFLMALVYAVLCACIIGYFGQPMIPVRGSGSLWIDRIILALTIGAFVVLIFYVFDVTRDCRRFIVEFYKKKPSWSGESIINFINNKYSTSEHLGELMLIRMVAKRTEIVGKFIFYPFIVWLIIFVSRLHYFDNWHMPLGLIIVITMSVVLVWGCAIALRLSAEKLRKSSLQRLKENYNLILFANQVSNKDEQLKQIDHVIKEITDIKEGAFLPLARHPIVQSLFVPFSGVGGAYLIEFLAKMNI
jgi:hypothetical protein